MTAVRRRVLRPSPAASVVDPKHMAQVHRRRTQLTKSKAAMRRWLTKLKRATNTVTQLHRLVTRLEDSLAESA